MKKTLKMNRESGFTLIGVLAIFTIVSVFGISLVMLSISSVKTSNTEHDDQSVFYIAEAGANYKVNQIERDVRNVYENDFSSVGNFYNEVTKEIKLDTEEYNEFEPNERGKEPKATINIEPINQNERNADPEPVKYKITSTGQIGDESRTVERSIEIGWPSSGDDGDESSKPGLLPPFAVYTLGDKLEIEDGTKIIGNVGTASTSFGDFDISSSTVITGDIYVPPETVDTEEKQKKVTKDIGAGVVKPYEKKDPVPNFPKFPDFDKPPKGEDSIEVESGVITWNQDKEFKEIKTKGSTYNVNFGNKDISISMKELKVEDSVINIDLGNNNHTILTNEVKIESSKINITGRGSLTILVLDEFEVSDDSLVNSFENISRLNVYSKEEIEIEESEFYGSLYVSNNNDDGKIEIEKSKVYGNIFINGKESKLKIHDESKVYSEIILAPSSEIEIEESTIDGPLIGNEVEIQEGILNQNPPPDLKLEGPLSFDVLDFTWPDIGQGNADNNGSNGNLIKPSNRPDITAPPIKEIPTNN